MVVVDLLTVEITLFIVCLLLSGFFSSSEVALISITRAKVRALVSQDRKGAKALDTLKRSTDTILITILIGNNIVNVAAASLATAIAIGIYGDVGIGIATGVTVILMLIFGEIGPKMYAPGITEEPGACVVAHPLPSKVIYPVLWVSDRIRRQFAFKPGRDRARRHEEEIKEWTTSARRRDHRGAGARHALPVLRFGDTTAARVRASYRRCHDRDTSSDRTPSPSSTRRVPLDPGYHERIDNVVGLLNVKTLWRRSPQQTDATIRA